MYVLKSRCVLGHLVPFNGEHRPYATQENAEKDADVVATVFGTEVVVVEYNSDAPVYYAGAGRLV